MFVRHQISPYVMALELVLHVTRAHESPSPPDGSGSLGRLLFTLADAHWATYHGQ